MGERILWKRHVDINKSNNCRRRLSDHMDCSSPTPLTTSFHPPPYASNDATTYVTPPYVTTTSSKPIPVCLERAELCKEHSPSPSSPLRRKLSSSASDDEMNVDSPDSGFESATPSGISNSEFFDESPKSEFSANPKTPVSRASSLDCDVIEDNRLCLIPPPKPEVKPTPKTENVVHKCHWDACSSVFPISRELHDHICSDHVDTSTKRFCCLWSGCKVYNTPARSIEWLKQHVGRHTGTKRFRCLLDGCDASFNSQNGLARHVPSHFSDVNLPKARVPGPERKVLVKRRKINDKKRALANIHDYTDQRTSEIMVTQLAKMLRHPITSLPTHTTDSVTSQKETKILCRRTTNGKAWYLTSNHTWIRSDRSKSPQLFFDQPSPHRRKHKAKQR